MRDSNRSEEAFGGLIADTMELPKVAPPTKQADDATPKRFRDGLSLS